MFDIKLSLLNTNSKDHKDSPFLANFNKLKLTNDLKEETIWDRISTIEINNFKLFTIIEDDPIIKILPINRSTQVLVLCIPSNIKEFIIKLKKDYINQIDHIIEIKQYYNDDYCIRLLIMFKLQNQADNFYYDYAGKCYFSSFEYLYCCFIRDISTINALEEDYIFDGYEIPSCPLCLESLDPYISKINSISLDFQNTSWMLFRKNCKICTLFTKESLLNCNECNIDNNNWCCLLCGYIGCNNCLVTFNN